MRSTVLQVRGHKSPLLLGGNTLGLRCSVDADRVMYNKCRRGADNRQKLLMLCRPRAQIFLSMPSLVLTKDRATVGEHLQT